MKKNKNIVRFHRVFHLNIGLVIFAIIIVYVLFNVYSYFTSTTIAEYEVTQGTIATNNIYKGLVLRNESVYYAEHSGYVNYYIRNASRVGVRDIIYSIDTDGGIAKKITATEEDGTKLSADSISKVQSEISAYTDSFSLNRFSTIYNFKNDLNSELSQNLSTTALSRMESSVEKALKANTFYQVHAQDSGIVMYYIDGFESLTPDNFVEENLNSANYLKTNLDISDRANVADPIFKLIVDEKWNVILPISEETAAQLEEKTVIRVRFCLDGYETYATSSVIKRGGSNYLNLEFTNAMIRYAAERYLDVELVLGAQVGLKIPNTAITTKDFFAIPEEFFAKGDNSNSNGVMVQKLVDGKVEAVFVVPSVYAQIDGYYYVDSEKLSNGDVLVKTDSKDTFTVGSKTGTLEGVYNINKGYAIFKQIKVLYSNREYSIVEMKTDYGIVLYDHIALDSSKVNENEFTVK